MKKLILITVLFAICGTLIFGQINTNHWFGNITASDIKANATLKNIKGISTSTSVFLRMAVTETAFEIPLKKGLEGQWFKNTGVGVSMAFWKLENDLPVERFTLNALLFTPTNNPGSNLSTAITGSVPIPKMDIFLINAGIRYDWKAQVLWLQTGITLEI